MRATSAGRISPGESGAASDAAGRVTVVWQRTGPLGWQLEVVTRARDGRFSAPVVVAASRRRLHSLQVRAEAPGAAAIIWTARDPGEVAEYCGGVFGGRGFPACEGVWATVRRGGEWLPSRRLAITNESDFRSSARDLTARSRPWSRMPGDWSFFALRRASTSPIPCASQAGAAYGVRVSISHPEDTPSLRGARMKTRPSWRHPAISTEPRR